MKTPIRKARLERGAVTQHRPQYVDPPTRQGNQSLSVPFALGPLAVVNVPNYKTVRTNVRALLSEVDVRGILLWRDVCPVKGFGRRRGVGFLLLAQSGGEPRVRYTTGRVLAAGSVG
jgi:hypothetical protein